MASLVYAVLGLPEILDDSYESEYPLNVVLREASVVIDGSVQWTGDLDLTRREHRFYDLVMLYQRPVAVYDKTQTKVWSTSHSESDFVKCEKSGQLRRKSQPALAGVNLGFYSGDRDSTLMQDTEDEILKERVNYLLSGY